jgi:YfiH family protein
MPFIQSGEIRYFHFANLLKSGCLHGIFTRKGGVSLQPWQSLNVGSTVGDDPEHVSENRNRSFQALNRQITTLYDVWQVHGTDVVCTDQPRRLDTAHIKADAIFTDRPGITLFMRFADCVPILLFDPVHMVVGIVHAGWKGTVNKIVNETISTMRVKYGCKPDDVCAGIGPSICAKHYPVGTQVVDEVKRSFVDDFDAVLFYQENAVHLDLWRANRILLEKNGIQNIETAELCTACNTDDWYSHRAEHGHTGRFGAMIALS